MLSSVKESTVEEAREEFHHMCSKKRAGKGNLLVRE